MPMRVPAECPQYRQVDERPQSMHEVDEEGANASSVLSP
jgi:hypothetical protein